jgi:hypothetical protein
VLTRDDGQDLFGGGQSKPLVKLFKLTRGFSHPSAQAE